MLNRGVIGQIKKLKRNFDKFQSCGEIESMHEFEVYVEMKAEDYPSFSIDNKKVMCYLK